MVRLREGERGGRERERERKRYKGTETKVWINL